MPVEFVTHTLIDAREIHELREQLSQLRDEYRTLKAKLQAMPAGKARGMTGHELSLLGKKGRELKARVTEIEHACLMKGVLV